LWWRQEARPSKSLDTLGGRKLHLAIHHLAREVAVVAGGEKTNKRILGEINRTMTEQYTHVIMKYSYRSILYSKLPFSKSFEQRLISDSDKWCNATVTGYSITFYTSYSRRMVMEWPNCTTMNDMNRIDFLISQNAITSSIFFYNRCT
jgi:hypothetical protein